MKTASVRMVLKGKNAEKLAETLCKQVCPTCGTVTKDGLGTMIEFGKNGHVTMDYGPLVLGAEPQSMQAEMARTRAVEDVKAEAAKLGDATDCEVASANWNL